MGYGAGGVEVAMVSLSDIQTNLKEYIRTAVPEGRYDNFIFKEVSDGWFGSKFRATREGIELYQIEGENITRPVKIAEVGIILKATGSLQKVGATYAEQTTVKGTDKKHHPVYAPDKDKSPADRIFAESKLANLVRIREHNGVTPPSTGVGIL